MKKILFMTAVIMLSLFSGSVKAQYSPQLEKMAEQGDTFAIHQMGVSYYMAAGIGRDYNKAADWFQIGADAGMTKSMVWLANCYQRGYGRPQNDGMAFYWYKKAADAGDYNALNHLGNCYRDGVGVAEDPEMAFECFQRASDAGNTAAMVNLGWMYYSGTVVERDFSKAVALFERAVEKDPRNRLAKAGLGYYYYHDLPFDNEEDDSDDAVRVRQEKAQKTLDMFSSINIEPEDRVNMPVIFGTCYYYLNDPQAVELLESSVQNENIEELVRASAYNFLGRIYMAGKCGVTQDTGKAIQLQQHSADLGNDDARSVLEAIFSFDFEDSGY